MAIILLSVIGIETLNSETKLPRDLNLEYFIFYGLIGLFLFIVIYGAILAACYLWLLVALNRHSKQEILASIESKFNTKSTLRSTLLWLIRVKS